MHYYSWITNTSNSRQYHQCCCSCCYICSTKMYYYYFYNIFYLYMWYVTDYVVCGMWYVVCGMWYIPPSLQLFVLFFYSSLSSSCSVLISLPADFLVLLICLQASTATVIHDNDMNMICFCTSCFITTLPPPIVSAAGNYWQLLVSISIGTAVK